MTRLSSFWGLIPLISILAGACNGTGGAQAGGTDGDTDTDSDSDSDYCDPPCDQGETCLEGNLCVCGDDPACADDEECVDGACIGPCNDGIDNDLDGWTDGDDPDCAGGDEDGGFGDTDCNDGVDNDGDGLTDSEDPECDGALGDEVLGTGPCVDVCVFDEVHPVTDKHCELYQPSTGTWEALDDGDGFLENRARLYNAWLRRHMEPEGGVMSAFYSDTSLTDVFAYGNTRDSAIWTGTYLAGESLRYLADGHPEALEHVDEMVEVLHRWFNVSGDPGYLARYVAPVGSDPEVLAIFDPGEPENHFAVLYGGESWNWKGHTSRDQYQGPMLGYSLAYEATQSDDVRGMIREDVVELVEQLMMTQTRTVRIVIDNLTPIPITLPAVELDFRYCVFAPSEAASNSPEILVDADDLGNTTIGGFQEFYPDLSELLTQIGALSWIPAVPRASSSIMLQSFFLVALQVTDGVAAYSDRRDAILAYYEVNADDWLDVSEGWSYSSVCGAKYYGTHIAFEPMYNLARLEFEAARLERIRGDVLEDRMWLGGVAGHKNVFFAFVHAANPPVGLDVAGVVDFHVDQLIQFPTAPLMPNALDLTSIYEEDPACEGLSLEPIDVGSRAVEDYMWQRGPWTMTNEAEENHTFPGIDYMLPYWMGRHHGFIEKDDPVQCLRWR